MEKQAVCLYGREKIILSGVKEIISFDEYGARLQTELGEVCVEGEGIRIKELNRERAEAEIYGKINSFAYEDGRERGRRGFCARLFG